MQFEDVLDNFVAPWPSSLGVPDVEAQLFYALVLGIFIRDN